MRLVGPGSPGRTEVCRTRDDGGMTLVELLIAMTTMLLIVSGFTLVYFASSSSGEGTQTLTASQGSTRTVLRILEADLRSADPLEQPPSSFALQADQTVDKDVLAMFETVDKFAACPTTPAQPPVPNGSNPYITLEPANVIWSFDAATRILTRWSYEQCTGDTVPKWHTGQTLHNVVDAAGTMFTLSTGGLLQRTTNTIANQPTCATVVTVSIQTRTRLQQKSFKVTVSLPLPNQSQVENTACN